MKSTIKSLLLSVIVVFGLLGIQSVYAQDTETDSLQIKNQNQYQHQYRYHKGMDKANGFVDENGDGINDNAPDADGDGIPNGLDPDYTPVKNGNGHGFIDEDGDGINDYALDDDGDGIPNGQDEDYVRPEDGTGRQLKHGYGKLNKSAGGAGEKGMGKQYRGGKE